MNTKIRKRGMITFATTMILSTACLLSACGTSASKASDSAKADTMAVAAEENEKFSVVTTIFPEYDWVKAVLGDKADSFELELLLDNGVDLHSYQPSAEDIAKIAASDLFIYVGGESDGWVEDVLKESANKDMQVINLLDVLGETVKEEEVVEGMEAEHDHEHEGEDHEDADHEEHEHEGEEHEDADHEEHEHEGEEHEEHDHDHHHGDAPEKDEHVWLSLRNAQTVVNVIAEKLGAIDQANAGDFTKNAEDYNKKLQDLDAKYADAVEGAEKKTMLFGDRFPFRYMADDYGIDYYAAFVGCSAETEASFDTVTFLSGKVDELGLENVCVIESSDQKIAETVIQNTRDKNHGIVVLDSMQSVKSSDVEQGVTYLSVMEKNLNALKDALK